MINMEVLHEIEGNNNYLWDTSALNSIVRDLIGQDMCLNAVNIKHRHYITTVQQREVFGVPDRKGTYDARTTWSESNTDIEELVKKMKMQRVTCVALFLRNFFILDGSMRILDNGSERAKMFNDIWNNNRKHIKDATIAEAAIYHGCILVTSDKRLCNKVNKYFPNNAVLYEDYINKYRN